MVSRGCRVSSFFLRFPPHVERTLSGLSLCFWTEAVLSSPACEEPAGNPLFIFSLPSFNVFVHHPWSPACYLIRLSPPRSSPPALPFSWFFFGHPSLWSLPRRRAGLPGVPRFDLFFIVLQVARFNPFLMSRVA